MAVRVFEAAFAGEAGGVAHLRGRAAGVAATSCLAGLAFANFPCSAVFVLAARFALVLGADLSLTAVGAGAAVAVFADPVFTKFVGSTIGIRFARFADTIVAEEACRFAVGGFEARHTGVGCGATALALAAIFVRTASCDAGSGGLPVGLADSEGWKVHRVAFFVITASDATTLFADGAVFAGCCGAAHFVFACTFFADLSFATGRVISAGRASFVLADLTVGARFCVVAFFVLTLFFHTDLSASTGIVVWARYTAAVLAELSVTARLSVAAFGALAFLLVADLSFTTGRIVGAFGASPALTDLAIAAGLGGCAKGRLTGATFANLVTSTRCVIAACDGGSGGRASDSPPYQRACQSYEPSFHCKPLRFLESGRSKVRTLTRSKGCVVSLLLESQGEYSIDLLRKVERTMA